MTAMALSPQDLQRIAQSPGWRGGRVEVCDTSQGKVIVKGWRPAHHPARYGLLNRLARWLGLPFLRAVPLAGGAQAQHTEVARLRALRRAGARVPEVLHVGSDHFVMQWLGRAHLGDVLQSGHPGAAALWREAGDELVRLHRAGQYLSQGFARNMIVTDEAGDTPRLAGLIDFEDDPLQVMGLADAQVRDWLAFLHSTLWILPLAPSEVDTCIDAWLDAESPAVRAGFAQACRRLAWLRVLPRQRRFGRDTVALQAAAAAAHRHARRHPISLDNRSN
ncbi:hypothetical protein [Ottowia sp.]|uniref:hypothetical protein n=1 Tax=Ottowia sp. TaxID=1898956 RepID=UPI002CDD7A36|nr:hypothetical protein [Ottowia sp.]MCZ2087879.1 hypothetical protein [Burkholderiales bacterium]HNR83231.1 hypothetical protein [Ottowia sp.]HNT85941.1 hypothetical protein [Ottowia sp.]